ncbi:complement factor H isoform X2 [Ictalurus furcatus]|nr:complement factor H isoform X2 [Ictalurus furcatus]
MGYNMQVAVKIFFFAFWVSSITLAENEECLKGNINYENTQISNLNERYTHGQTVKLSCATGYVGSLRLECENGIWTKIAGRECKKKPCGHPGDTPNGDFKLIKDSEFVFGATVEYTCRPGYIMASRVKHRNCRIDGWDNAVPVCEVVKCLIISNLGDVIATGNTEEASYGDVIHFECASHDKMLQGPEDIHCKSDGQWSDKIPKCIEIKCLPPEIPHGFTNPDKEYKENNILQYSCEKGYNPRPGNPRCTKYGWSIKPECEVITCLLGSPTTGVVSTKPIGKNIFLAGEYVEIICSKKYWIFITKQVSQNIKCKEDGKWEFRPVCEEITCEYPRREHLLNNPSYYKHIYKLGENTWYRCEYGYQPTPASITCTENGWEPEPRCIEITCQKPEIAHGEVMGIQKNTYNRNVKIELRCNQGYEPKRFLVTCNQNGEWDNMRQCTLVKCPIISNLGDVIAKGNTEEASYGDVIHFECASHDKMLEGPEEIHCKDDGQWSDKKPKCIEKTTCAGASVENGFTHKLPGGFSYSCHTNYKAFDEKWWGVVICTEGPQSYAPLCIPNDQCGQIPNVHAKKIQVKKGYKNEETVEFECESKPCCFKCISGTWQDCQCIPPSVENAVITSHSQHQVEYTCRNNYTITGKRLISCNSSQWKELPTCKLGINLRCQDPEREINDAIRNDPNLKAYYEEGGGVQYKCREDFYFQNGSKAVCSAGKWKYPQCIKLDINLRCQDPEREINDAIRNDTNLKAYYEEGGGVQYKCKEGFHFQNGSKAVCSSGKWNYPQCIK